MAGSVSTSNPKSEADIDEGFTHPIALRLTQFNIRNIAIIDDVFDHELPDRSNFSDADLNSFLTEVADSDQATEEMEQFGHNISSVDEISNEVIAAFWRAKDRVVALRPLLELSIYPTIQAYQNQLEPLRQCLADDLRLQVTLVGVNTPLSDVVYDIVFLDYNLGLGEPNASHIENAQRRAREIYHQCADNRKPLIILMSNLSVTEDKISAFREKSDLLGGMFHFEKKVDLNNKKRLLLTMGAVASALPGQLEIQSFQDAVFLACEEAVGKFKAGLKALRLDDYLYIQRISLQNDGHPLGDYMLWLYANYLSDLLQNNSSLQTAQKKLNQSDFSAPLPPNLRMPTNQLSKIYQSVLFDESIGDVGPHPAILCKPTKKGDDYHDPYLQLGDIFIRKEDRDRTGKQQIYMIINAPCDLQFSPNQTRKIDDDFVLLLTRGSLHELDSAIPIANGQPGIVTQLFNYEGKTYRIFWNPEHFISISYRDFVAWKKGNGKRKPPIQKSTRVARMRLPFVLEIQQSFVGNLSRIGVPVAPPIRYAAQAQFLYCGQDGILNQFTEPRPDLVSLRYVVGPNPVVECRLSRDCIWLVSEEIERFVATNLLSGITARRMQKLKDLATDHDKLMKLLEPFLIDASNQANINGVVIGFLRNKKPNDKVLSQDAFFWLNIVDDQINSIRLTDKEILTQDNDK